MEPQGAEALVDSRKHANVASPAIADRVHATLYPDYVAGGFAPTAHFVQYFNRVNALITPESHVLDFGAGRGKFADIESGWKLQLCSLRSRSAKVIGVDVDPIVLTNQMTDQNYLIGKDGKIPLPDNSIDLVTSWAVFEHVADPMVAAQELTRVLKPGGWLCAWTPNKWGYVGLAARLVPNRHHVTVLRKLGIDGRADEDVFPVVYRMNTRRDLRQLFPLDRFDHFVAVHNGPPGYHGGHAVLAKLIRLYGALCPTPLRSMLHIFLRKKG